MRALTTLIAAAAFLATTGLTSMAGAEHKAGSELAGTVNVRKPAKTLPGKPHQTRRRSGDDGYEFIDIPPGVLPGGQHGVRHR